MTRVLRIGISGCGRLAEVGYLPALAGLGPVRIDALCDPNPARLAALAWRLDRDGSQPRTYPDAASMLAGGGLDGVIVASPAERHVGDARIAAAAGIAALVEKPPAPTLEGALELARLEPQPHLAFNRRFGVLAQLAPALAAEIGGRDPSGLELDLEISYRRASWRAVSVRDDALLDLGPHLVDLAAWLVGRPVRSARTSVLTPERARFELQLGDGGAVARIALATDSPHRERGHAERGGRRIASVGTPGRVRGLALRATRSEHPLVSSLRDVTLAYATALGGGGEGGRLGSVADGARAMAAIEAVRRSVASGGRWEDAGLHEPVETHGRAAARRARIRRAS